MAAPAEGPKDATPITQAQNRAILDALPIGDTQDFEDARRGFLATMPAVEIKNAQGQTVANLQAPALKGIGRVSWDLKPTKDVLTDYGSEGVLHVRSGTYEATLTVESAKSSQKFEVAIAPGVETR